MSIWKKANKTSTTVGLHLGTPEEFRTNVPGVAFSWEGTIELLRNATKPLRCAGRKVVADNGQASRVGRGFVNGQELADELTAVLGKEAPGAADDIDRLNEILNRARGTPVIREDNGQPVPVA